jgi:hypothetical protein
VSSQELENSLRADIENYLNSRLSDVREEISNLRSQLKEQIDDTFSRLINRFEANGELDASVTSAVSNALRTAHIRGMEESGTAPALSRTGSDIALLKAAIEDIDGQASQSEILNALVNRSASFAPRVIFFVVKSENANGWRARGIEDSRDDIRDISIPLSANTLIGEAVRSRVTWSGQPGANADNHMLLSSIGPNPPMRMVAVPLVARGKSAAVLYADSGSQGPESVQLEALETLVKFAGTAVELLAVRRTGAGASAAPARPVEQPQYSAAPTPQATHEAYSDDYRDDTYDTYKEESYSSRSAIPTLAPVSAPQTVPEPEQVHYHEPEREEAAVTPEPSISPVGTQASSSQFVTRLGGAKQYGRGAENDLPVDVSEEERKLHNEARRFARLLVSEIKLYNEQKLREGQESSDIYDRLREDIDRSRQMYEKRVAPNVASKYDYFHHEVVRTLAGGDASKLGNGYPGASASA